MSDKKPDYQQIGALGGKASRERHGRDHYREIGRAGGEATLERYHGTSHYVELGRKGAARRAELIRQGREAIEREGR